MKKKFTVFIVLLISLFVSVFSWDLVSFSPNTSFSLENFSNTQNFINPLNDPFRFVIFLTIPFLSLVLLFQFQKKIFFKNLQSIIFINSNSKIQLNKFEKKELNIYSVIIIFILFLEFLSLNLNQFSNDIDFFHEGMWLSASQNLKLSGEYWSSSYVVRGFFGDFYPYFLWETFNLESVGITRFFKLTILFINKILIVLIIRKLSLLTNFKNNSLLIFFILLLTLFLSLQGYGSPIFTIRSFLYLLFIFLFLNFLGNYKTKSFYIFSLGFLSSLSFFWYIDIAVYINISLLLLLIFFLIKKETNFLLLLSSILVGWFIIFLSLPKNELIEFSKNTYSILKTLNWIHGLPFPKPLLSFEGRSNKALILFLISGLLLIQMINSNKGLNKNFLLAISFIIICSIIYFNYALGRSDGPHIRIGTGFIFLPFFALILFKTIEKYELYFKKQRFFKYFKTLLLLLFLSLTLLVNKDFENKKLTNVVNFKSSVKKLINHKDNEFISEEHQSFLSYFKALTDQDDCITIFTNESAFYYLFKKQSCTKYYFKWVSSPLKIQKKIISDLMKKKPQYIVNDSKGDIFKGSDQKMKLVNNFISENYDFYAEYKSWNILKIKDKS